MAGLGMAGQQAAEEDPSRYHVPSGIDSQHATHEAFAETVSFLEGACRFGMNPSLEGIRALTAALGYPNRRFVSIQVAGTNGKSSTARMLAALLHAEGFKVGLYTSPGLVSYLDRYEIDGMRVSEGRFVEVMNHVREVADRTGGMHAGDADGPETRVHVTQERVTERIPAAAQEPYTEFEYLTAAALDLFAEAQVDFAVLEVGLGGRWDATSIVDPSVAVVCGIGLDHQSILGSSLDQIAAEKAAIIKPATTAVLGAGTASVQQVFRDRADECDAGLVVVEPQGRRLFPDVIPELAVTYAGERSGDDLACSVQGRHARYDGLVLPQAPPYQLENAACAIAAAEAALGRALSVERARMGLAEVRFPGRFATLSDDPLLIVDGAHNPQAARALAKAIDERFAGEDMPLLLLAVLSDKDAASIVETLAPSVDTIAVTQTSSPRALSCRKLADVVRSCTGREPLVFPTIDEALLGLIVNGDGTPVVATGSITLAGELTRLFGQ
jgi:dihydrofolate synthase/folylpolyglutamate synthase